MELEHLTGDVEYRMNPGKPIESSNIGHARITSDVRRAAGCDTPLSTRPFGNALSAGTPFKWAWNGYIHLRFTQDDVDNQQVWVKDLRPENGVTDVLIER